MCTLMSTIPFSIYVKTNTSPDTLIYVKYVWFSYAAHLFLLHLGKMFLYYQIFHCVYVCILLSLGRLDVETLFISITIYIYFNVNETERWIYTNTRNTKKKKYVQPSCATIQWYISWQKHITKIYNVGIELEQWHHIYHIRNTTLWHFTRPTYESLQQPIAIERIHTEHLLFFSCFSYFSSIFFCPTRNLHE